MALANANLANGNLREVLQFEAGKAFGEIPFMDVLDYISAHPQVKGHILEGHMTAKIKGVALEPLGVSAPGIGKTNLGLMHQLAG
jgi:hypothetical protein